MRSQLIMLEDYNIVVNNDKIKKGDLIVEYRSTVGYYDEDEDNAPIIKDKNSDSGFNYSFTINPKKLIASDNPDHNLPIIDYNGLERMLGIFNVEKLSEGFISNNGSFRKNGFNQAAWEAGKNGFKEGFKKLQELSDKEFTFDDMVKAMEFIIDFKFDLSEDFIKHNYGVSNADSLNDKDAMNAFIRILRQPKVFDVEGVFTNDKFQIVRVL